MKKINLNNDYLIEQSKKCLEKSKKCLNDKDIDLAIFYNNASIGYMIKVENLKYFEK